MSEECPAGGDHVWTADVDVRYDDPLSMFYLRPNQRWHCDECGQKMPDE